MINCTARNGAVSLAASVCVCAFAQNSVPAPQLQRVEITGSHIARIEDETSSPVQIITREEIARTGAKTVKEALERLVPTASGTTELGTTGFTAPGYDGAALGPMGANATLLLLNFRRVAPYPLAHDSSIVTNVNTLPLEAVDRIEVLRSGASAIYGSEAIAGVINIITRPGFEGVKLRAQHEYSQHSGSFGSSGAALSLGLGNFAKDGFNVMSNIELYQRDSVIWRDVLQYVNPSYLDLTKFPAMGSFSTFSYPGNLIGSNPGPVAGCDQSLIVNGLCRYDRYRRFELIAAGQRVTAFNTAQLQLSGETRAFAELLLSDSRTQYVAPFAPYGPALGSGQWVVPATGEVKTFTYRGLPAGHPLNTSGQDNLELRYRFADGLSDTSVRTLQHRALAGLRGMWHKLDWEAAVGTMGGRTKQRDHGGFSDSGFRQTIGNYDSSRTDPLFFNRGYKIGQPNSAEVINSLFPEYGYDGRVTRHFADARLNGPAFRMPAGDARMATGMDLRLERHSIQPTDLLASGDIIGGGLRAVDDQRKAGAVFGELSLPVSDAVTVDLAGRVDKFSRFAAHFSPKLGMRLAPNNAFTVRATVEGGFRAPNLVESANSADYGFQANFQDPRRCPQAMTLVADLRAQAAKLAATDPQRLLLAVRADNVESGECHGAVTTVQLGNPDLQPETATTANLGIVFQPRAGWSVSADYWSINRRNEIGQKSFVDALLIEDELPAGVIVRRELANDPTFSAAERAKYGVTAGALQTLTAKFENGAATKLSGIDFAMRGQMLTPLGKLDLGANATVYLERRIYSLALRRFSVNMIGLQGNSRVLANLTASLTHSDFTHGLIYKYQKGTVFHLSLDDAYYTPKDCASRGWTDGECRYGDTKNLDYSIAYRGIKNMVLSGFVRNVFDRHQARNLMSVSAGGGGIIPQDYRDAQGRVMGVVAEYRFK
ncbi:MAG: TonB-dependent receptor [Hylemonella sp.]|nr:TonB-dependent receptor [Hylemonella sp.]